MDIYVPPAAAVADNLLDDASITDGAVAAYRWSGGGKCYK